MAKLDHQMRRARLMIQAFDDRIRRPAAELVLLAESMTEVQWQEWGTEVCGFERPPSTETQKLAIELLKERVKVDIRYAERTHGNNKYWENQ